MLGTSRFKGWFEGIERVVRNRQAEIESNMGIPQEEIGRWTHGYMPDSELVFVFKGLSLGHTQISIQKWRPDFNRLHVWAASGAAQEAQETPILSDAERQAHAEKVRERKAQKRRARAAKKKAKDEKDDEDGEEGEEVTEEEALEASRTFEELLAEMKAEELERRAGQRPRGS